MRTSSRLAADREAVIAYLLAAVPGLDHDGAAGALERAGSAGPGSLRQIAAHLAGHPDPLRTHRQDIPPGLIRLAWRLHAEGHDWVIPPRCAGCGTITAALNSLSPAGRICVTCKARAHRTQCARCGRIAAPAARRPDGLICATCYDREPSRIQPCGQCGQPARIAGRAADGTPLCPRCQPRPARTCHSCGAARPTAAITPDGPVCHRCYRSPSRLCGGCGQIRPVKKRAGPGNPDLCSACYRGPAAVCSVCSRTRPCSYATGKPVCPSCVPLRVQACCRCAKQRPVKASWPIGPVCAPCYGYIRSHPASCHACGTAQPLIARASSGELICGPCAGLAVDYGCRRCGAAGFLLSYGRCAGCVLDDRLTELTDRARNRPGSEQISVLAQALAWAGRPVTVLRWLSYGHSAGLVHRLLEHDGPLTHQHLDALPPSKAVHYIRDVLVGAGVLPSRDEHLERITPWLDQFLATRPPGNVRLIQPYAHWFLLPRARRKNHGGLTSSTTADSIRARITAAVALLDWLRQHGTDLSALTQDQLDQWLLAGPGRHTPIQPFISWTTRHKITRDVAVKGRPAAGPAGFLDDREQARQLRTCLNDTGMPLDLRVVGALVLVYGLPLSKIAYLTRNDITRHDGQTWLRHHGRQILLPPRLAALIGQLALQPAPGTILTRLAGPPSWLFPGNDPTRPASHAYLRTGLRRHGITTHAARNTAVGALAAELPAPVLAGITGLHISTATRWTRSTRRDWTEYVAARTPHQNEIAGDEGLLQYARHSPRLHDSTQAAAAQHHHL